MKAGNIFKWVSPPQDSGISVGDIDMVMAVYEDQGEVKTASTGNQSQALISKQEYMGNFMGSLTNYMLPSFRTMNPRTFMRLSYEFDKACRGNYVASASLTIKLATVSVKFTKAAEGFASDIVGESEGKRFSTIAYNLYGYALGREIETLDDLIEACGHFNNGNV